MATSQAVPAPVEAQASGPGGSRATESSQALVPATMGLELEEPPAFGGPVVRLPVELDVAVPVRQFRVRHLLALVPGQIVETQWGNGDDVPLAAGEVQLAWTEFEVIETELAVRVTRLA